MVQKDVLNIIIWKETYNKLAQKEKVTDWKSKTSMDTIKITKKRLLTRIVTSKNQNY